MLTGTNDERHNLFYAGVFPCQRKSEKKNKKAKRSRQANKIRKQRISNT